ncbi:hypothetical protein L0M17_03400 [Sinomonas sp. 5-5]|uniref:Lipoprotein n=2 Tax=Sinomonas terrae TaxID=2908838 RepID=A0ABS9TX90_9MICC|nr:hypothetical protein [Sinomonas terrae]MCH6469041.1 hypothetical protein [Sinomonas terrae]
MRDGLIAIVLALALSFGVSGCANKPFEASEVDLAGVESVRARLDTEAGTIRMPLDDVLFSPTERILVQQANNILMSRCLAKSQINLSKDFGVFKPDQEDGRYGIWVQRLADENGYAKTNREGISPESTAPYDAQEGFRDAYVKCRDDLQGSLIVMRQIGRPEAPEAIQRIDSMAYGSAMKAPAWRKAKQDWRDCLQERGVVVSEDKDSWVPQVPVDELNQQIRTAKIDIDCKNRTNLIQKVADLEAKFQAIYMARDQAAINSLRSAKAVDLARAREIVSGVRTADEAR